MHQDGWEKRLQQARGNTRSAASAVVLMLVLISVFMLQGIDGFDAL